MLPSGICFCDRRIGAPRPTSITSRRPAASTNVLGPNRSGEGIGLPVPSRVTVMLPLAPPTPLVGVSPPQPVIAGAPPFAVVPPAAAPVPPLPAPVWQFCPSPALPALPCVL